jgi:GH24 family phage-related lysozyme (muramidase)
MTPVSGGGDNPHASPWAAGDGIDRPAAPIAWVPAAIPAHHGPSGVAGHAKAAASSPSSRELVAELMHMEGNVGHMYLDTKGLVTTGIGNLVKTPEAARKLPWVDTETGKPATPEQIDQAFATVHGMNKGLKAGEYGGATTLRLSTNVVRDLALGRLDREFLPGLRRQFPHFDSYPAPAQRALVDMIYSMGEGGIARYHNLRAVCEAGDWTAAAGECHRKDGRNSRNAWTSNQFLKAATINS